MMLWGRQSTKHRSA